MGCSCYIQQDEVFVSVLYLRKRNRELLNKRSTSTPFVTFHVIAVFLTVTVFSQLFPRNSSVSVLMESIDKLRKHKKIL
jgi:hypothetical protein